MPARRDYQEDYSADGPNIPDPRDFAPQNAHARFRRRLNLAKNATPADIAALRAQLTGFVMLHGGKAEEPHNAPMIAPYYDDPEELPLLTKPWAATSEIEFAGDFVRRLAPVAALALNVGEEIALRARYTIPHYYTDVPIPPDPYDMKPHDITAWSPVDPMALFHVDSDLQGVDCVNFWVSEEGSESTRDVEPEEGAPWSTDPGYIKPRDCWAMGVILDALVELSPEELARHATPSVDLS